MSASVTDFFYSPSTSTPARPQVTRRRGTFQSLNKSLGRLSLSNLNIKFFSLQIPRRRRAVPSIISTANSTTNFDKDSEDAISLPYDVIFIIADLLYQSDLVSLCLTSKTLYDLLLPLLYHTVILRSSSSCVSFLTRLSDADESKSARLCGYLRELAVRPNYYLAWPEPEGSESPGKSSGKGKGKKGVDEAWVADKIAELAPKMRKLDTFDWDGCEMPKDELWTALQKNCPDLRTVYSNVGYNELNPDSALFSFSNLVAFSLTVRHGLSATSPLNINPHPNTDFTPLEPLPTKLWDMLTQRCPDLEEMTLCSFSSGVRNFDVQPLFITASSSIETTGDSENRNKVPLAKLSALTLGTFGYTEEFSLTPPMPLSFLVPPSSMTSSVSLGAFLLSHPELKYLRFSWNFRRWLSPPSVPIFFPFPAAATEPILPALTTFSGIYQHLRPLPNSTLANIQVLDLTSEPIYEDRVSTVCEILGFLDGLRELDIWVHLDFSITTTDDQIPNYHQNHIITQRVRRQIGRRLSLPFLGSTIGENAEPPVPAYEQVFRRILGQCSGVEDLHWMSTTPLGPQPLASLARSLGLLKGLKSFSLTKGHSYKDDFSFGVGPIGSVRRTMQSGPGMNGGMLKSALTIINTCERLGVFLEQVNIRWARENCPNHLKQEGIYDVVRDVSTAQEIFTRSGKVREGEDQTEVIGVDVYERGITMPGGVFKRRYRYGYNRPQTRLGETEGKRKDSADKMRRGKVDKGKGKAKQQDVPDAEEGKTTKRAKNTQEGLIENGDDENIPEDSQKNGTALRRHMKRISRRFSSFTLSPPALDDNASASSET